MKNEGLISVADSITSDIAAQIQAGKLIPGFQLPTERELATKYGTSRAAIRRGLEALEKGGLITRNVGRGTFVSEPATLPSVILSLGDVSPADIAVARLMFEPAIAEYAAVHATASDLRTIEECLRQSDQSDDASGFDHWDLQLHIAIAAAAHNSFVDFTMKGVTEIRKTIGWTRITVLTATNARREIHKKDHKAIVDALISRDGAAARESMRRHLQKVMQFMLGNTASTEPVYKQD